ncbi:hypothetical protein F5B20DRAFT_569207 [Whalleya microplaca]|nr:hypothetical protein F5B20DRAFT_569207 [Whalleya microplaca]
MFGGFVNMIQPPTIGPPPKDVPPATPIKLPQCNPQLPEASGTTREGAQPSLVRFLQTLHRPTELSESHFAALGVHVHVDVPAEGIVPDPSYLPSSGPEWAGMGLDAARRKDETFRRPLSNGNFSPEARVYLERRAELSVANQAAFRTVRRIKPEPGKPQPRLGNCYEFFKQMELMAAFWDDTSLPPLSEDGGDEGDNDGDKKKKDEETSLPTRPHLTDASPEQQQQPDPTKVAAPTESNTRSSAPDAASDNKPKPSAPQRVTYRTGPGSQMPPEFRHNLIAAFVKLVAYDFGCNVAPPRVEPRLHLLEPPPPVPPQHPRRPYNPPPTQKASYFPSGCVFLYRSPTTRDAARAGVVEGPLAAVSARNTTNFAAPADSHVDFGRELVAALITAQHRAREGKAERRFGEGKWWATAKRWGGGEGGPIGREVEGDSVVGDKDNVPEGAAGNAEKPSASAGGAAAAGSAGGGATPEKGGRPVVPIPVRGQPVNKKPRKNLSMYDSYRMVRLPASNWDKKARFEAIGKIRGADYDDVFVLSSLFHHFCVLRVRVPSRLLEVMGGASEDERPRSWGRLEMWRSKWFDLFVVEDRLEAMRLLWGMTAWVMRKNDEEADTKQGKGEGGDVSMKDA